MDSLNERLNHLRHNETSHSKAFDLLQENVSNKTENKASYVQNMKSAKLY